MEFTNIFNIITQVINCTPDGEILDINNFSRVPIGPEDSYIKWYLNSLEKMATELKPTTMRVLMILMRFANYSERGRLVILKNEKIYVAEKLGVSLVTIQKSIQELKNKNFLFPISRATYGLNPFYCGIGPWAEIKALRLSSQFHQAGKNVKFLGYTKNYIELEEILRENEKSNDNHRQVGISSECCQEDSGRR